MTRMKLSILIFVTLCCLSSLCKADIIWKKDFGDLYLRSDKTQTYSMKDYVEDDSSLTFVSNSDAVTFASNDDPTYTMEQSLGGQKMIVDASKFSDSVFPGRHLVKISATKDKKTSDKNLIVKTFGNYMDPWIWDPKHGTCSKDNLETEQVFLYGTLESGTVIGGCYFK